MEHREAGADLLRDGEQVELAAQLAVVALLRLGEEVQVLLQLVLGRPGGAVDALEHGVLLAAAPVGGRVAHQLERRDEAGGGQVRTAAEVLPAQLAGLGVQVVVDRQLAGADLDVRAVVRRRRALEADQLQLVRLVGQLLTGGLVRHDPAGELLAPLLDLLHLLLDGLEVLGRERPLDVEVVVEAVLDGRADAELGLGEELLHRLRHHVRGGVAQDVQAVLGGELDALDLVAVGECVRQVPELAAHPRGDDRALAGEELGGRGARRHRALFPLGIALDDHTDVCHRSLLTEGGAAPYRSARMRGIVPTRTRPPRNQCSGPPHRRPVPVSPPRRSPPGTPRCRRSPGGTSSGGPVPPRPPAPLRRPRPP